MQAVVNSEQAVSMTVTIRSIAHAFAAHLIHSLIALRGTDR